MGEPATEMNVTDSAKASRGLNLVLKKAMVQTWMDFKYKKNEKIYVLFVPPYLTKKAISHSYHRIIYKKPPRGPF